MFQPLSTLRAPLVFPGQKIGLFGGSFNPPHAGHRHVAEVALKRLGLDAIWWLVSPQNPLKDPSAPFDARRAAVARLARGSRHHLATVESQLAIGYSAQLLDALAKRYPRVRFVWVMGADNLATFHRWQRWRDILRTVPVAVVARPGYGLNALMSPAARAFRFAQVGEPGARGLASRAPPAWIFLNARLNPLSSTALRAQASKL